MSISDFAENELLDAICAASAYSAAAVYIKLHTGDPGEAATSNAATETTRKVVTFGAASSGTSTSNADATWTNVSTTETITHVSLWDASSGGNALWSGALTASKALTAGDTFSILSGSLSVSLS